MQHVTIVGFKKALGTSLTIPMEMLNAADLIQRIGGSHKPKLQMQLDADMQAKAAQQKEEKRKVFAIFFSCFGNSLSRF